MTFLPEEGERAGYAVRELPRGGKKKKGEKRKGEPSHSLPGVGRGGRREIRLRDDAR